jgi:hypothetical protein
MPTDDEIDYRQYTRDELSEALANIDRRQYPQNYEHLITEIAARESGSRYVPPPERPKRVAQLFELRGNIKVSKVTKLLYGVCGAFYFCMPLYLIFAFHRPIETLGWRVLAIALVWIVAAFHLFGLCVTYNFESGVVKCLWFGRDVIWQEKLDTLQDVETSVARGLVTIYFVWPNHRRRLWLRESDLIPPT